MDSSVDDTTLSYTLHSSKSDTHVAFTVSWPHTSTLALFHHICFSYLLLLSSCLTPTLTCLSWIPLSSSLVSLILFSSPPLQPTRAASPVWCESHWTAFPWLHAHLYMSAGLLFGRRIRAQDLQVRWELDRETTSLCRYKHGYITSEREQREWY